MLSDVLSHLWLVFPPNPELSRAINDFLKVAGVAVFDMHIIKIMHSGNKTICSMY